MESFRKFSEAKRIWKLLNIYKVDKICLIMDYKKKRCFTDINILSVQINISRTGYVVLILLRNQSEGSNITAHVRTKRTAILDYESLLS